MKSMWDTETVGGFLPDGTFVELVRKDESGALGLLTWDGTSDTLADHIWCKGRNYIPIALDPTIRRAMRFPSRTMAYGSTPELFTDLCRVIARFHDLPERLILHVAYFIFATWLIDWIPVAPFLSILAPPTAPSVPLLQLLALLCRRSLLLGELSPAGLCTLPMDLKPTLLVSAVELSTSLQRLLRATSHQGAYIARGGQALDLYCSKVVCSQEPLHDPSLIGLAVQIALAPTHRCLPVLDAQVSAQIADEFQARLLHYRLTNHPDVRTPNIDVVGLTAPTQSVARSLAACLVGAEELQSGVVPLLLPQDEEIQVERSAGLESVVLEALLFCCHDGDRSSVRAAELAEIANTILAGRGRGLQISPETVGWKLKALGFRTKSIGSGGKGLYLLDEIRTRIHKLARDYAVPSVEKGPMNQCPHCSQVNDAPGEQNR
jgi:hypothetical protein